MVKTCCVPGCKHSFSSIAPDPEISFHKFPKKNRAKWIEVVGLSSVSEHSLVCSAHFKREDFASSSLSGEKSRTRLLPTAIPSIFPAKETLAPQRSLEENFLKVFCVICSEYCSQDAHMSVITNCGHVFHTACLTRWLRENLNCPQCRRDAGANSIKNLFIDAGPERPSASPEDAFSLGFVPRPAFLEGRERTADQIIQQLRDQLDRLKEERDSMVQRTHLQIDEALKRYKYIEKKFEEGSAELDSSMNNGERCWKNLACDLKRRLSLANAEMRDLEFRNNPLNRWCRSSTLHQRAIR